jgi:WD40 repeat protein
MLIIKLNNKNYFIDQILIGHSLGIIKAIQLKNGDIASSSIDNTIKIWKENKKNNIFQCQNTISVHSNNIHSILEIPITNELVSSSNQERTLRFFNLISYANSYTIEKIDPCGFMGVLYLIDNNILAVGTTSGLSLINLIEHKEIIKMKLNSIYSFFRLKSGSLLTGEGKAIQEWKNIEKRYEIHKGNVTCFAQFDNGILVTCSLDKCIFLYH